MIPKIKTTTNVQAAINNCKSAIIFPPELLQSILTDLNNKVGLSVNKKSRNKHNTLLLRVIVWQVS